MLFIESGDLRSLVYISRAIALAFKYTTAEAAATAAAASMSGAADGVSGAGRD